MKNNEKELYNKLKERIAISNFDDEMQNKNYEIKEESVVNMKKRILQPVLTIIIMFVASITVYAGVTGNLNFEKLGLFKLSQNYDEIATEINKSIENEYCKITLNKMAGDSAYLITEYTIDFKENAPEEFRQIEYDENRGCNLGLFGTVNINSKPKENVMTYIDKITENEFKYIQIINVMDEKDEHLKFEKDFDVLYTGEWLEESKIEINKKIIANITLKRENIKKFEQTERKIDKNNTLIIEDFANTKFESFIRVKQIEQDITFKEYNNFEYDSFLITNNKDEIIPHTVYSGDIYGAKMYVKKNGKYIQPEIDYQYKSDDIVKVEENYTILIGLKDNLNQIKITPIKTRLYNDRTDEEEIEYNKAIWYDLTEGNKKYSKKSSLGGTLEINRIEIDEKNITFYYEKKGKVENQSYVIIRKNNGIMNYICPTEVKEKELSGIENKIVFSRIGKNGCGMIRK